MLGARGAAGFLQHLHTSISFCSSACVVFSVCIRKASMVQGGLLLCFFLSFLAPAEVAAGLLALAACVAVDAFSLV